MTEHPRAADDGHTEEQGHRPGMRSSRRPRYLKIAETLREEIRVGVHAVGGILGALLDSNRYLFSATLKVGDSAPSPLT